MRSPIAATIYLFICYVYGVAFMLRLFQMEFDIQTVIMLANALLFGNLFIKCLK